MSGSNITQIVAEIFSILSGLFELVALYGWLLLSEVTVELTIVFGSRGEAIYSDETIELLQACGNVSIARASHVEPSEGGWSADMSPVGGPVLGPFGRRSDAIDAEVRWLKENLGL